MYICASEEEDQSSMTSPLPTTSANNNVDTLPKSPSLHISKRKPHNSRHLSSTSLPTTFILLVTLLLSLTPTTASAYPYSAISDTLIDPLPNSPATFRIELAELEANGIILTDPRPPPDHPSAWNLPSISAELIKRDNVEIDKRQASSSTSSTTPSVTSISPTITTTSSPTEETSALPSPFDSNIGANFTSQSCPDFLEGFLNTPEFKACLPFSLLLESSHSFFETSKSPFLTTDLLDHTCASNATACTPYLSTLATTLTHPSACGNDYRLGNPTVHLAYAGLVAYEPLYAASCLKSPTGSYCFVDAVTNSTSPTDSYVYYLGLGEELPAGTQMTCNECLSDTVAILGVSSANRTQPVASVYVGAAKVVNTFCGPAWVNVTIPAPMSGAARGSGGGGLGSGLAVVLGVVSGMLLLL